LWIDFLLLIKERYKAMFWPLAMAVISLELRTHQAFSFGGEGIDLESEMMKARACVAGGAIMSINRMKKRLVPRVGRTAHAPNCYDHIHITQTKRTKRLSIIPGILLPSSSRQHKTPESARVSF
jgi:hypothetical protein